MTAIDELQRTGIRREGSPQRGFRWVGATRSDRERLEGLKLPPAWTHVFATRRPSDRLQAIGRDKAGRWQYRYSDRAVEERERRKHARLLAFAKALPALRREIDRGLSQPGLGHDKVMACLLRILSTCFMRPGSEVYARENGSFGIVTLQNRHAQVHGDAVRFDYVGKAGKRQVRELRDRRVARTVRELKKLPGRALFQYLTDDGAVVKVTPAALNAHLRSVLGGRFSAKDFRTWSATLVCANVLARLHGEIVPGRTDRRRLITAAVKETAAQLGNTPAVCKSSYIWPSILSSFYEGKVLSPFFPTAEELVASPGRRGIRAERALLQLLRQGKDAVPVALAKKLARRGLEGARRETALAARMRKSPRARRLAEAFAAS